MIVPNYPPATKPATTARCFAESNLRRFVDRIVTCSSFASNSSGPRRTEYIYGKRNVKSHFSPAAGRWCGYELDRGGEQSLRWQMEGEPVQKQTLRRNEG